MTENGQDQVPDRAGEPTTMRFQGIGEPSEVDSLLDVAGYKKVLEDA